MCVKLMADDFREKTFDECTRECAWDVYSASRLDSRTSEVICLGLAGSWTD